MKNYKCSICHSESREIGEKDNFQIIRCSVCKLEEVYNKPRGIELSDLYANRQVRIWKDFNFKRYFKDFKETNNNPKRDEFRFLVNNTKIRTKKNKLKILEIGCGKGPLIDWANHNGHYAIGVESSEVICDFLRKKSSLDIRFIKDNDYSHLTEDSFDLIYLEHSLEHHSNLKFTLKSLRQKLSSKGLIHVIVPNHGSKIARKKKLKWLNYSPPHHLYFFNKENLSNAFQLNNYLILDIRETLRFDSGVWNFYSLDRYINFVIRLINKFFNLGIRQMKYKNKYPRSIFDFIRLLPYFVYQKKVDEELLITAYKNNEFT
tara:strand:- start:126 stop:1079 length:954 start_codon:yes stop_codon:yes gene_type:complete